jgi:hypothetical protein
MTYGKRTNGSGVLELNPSEVKTLEAGRPVVKVSADARGEFRIVVKVSRPRRKA